jgi:acyl carrier protein
MTVQQAIDSEIRATLTDELSQLADLSPEQLKPDATFEELDIDSLDLVELDQIVEERYGVRLGRDEMKDVRTVGEALDLIVARCT